MIEKITFDMSKLKSNIETHKAWCESRLKKYLMKPEIQELINNNEWEEVFNHMGIDDSKYLCSLLLVANVDYLDYLTSIKWAVLPNNAPSRCIQSLYVPNNIKQIEMFYITEIEDKLSLPKNITFKERLYVTEGRKRPYIAYRGTMEDLKNTIKNSGLDRLFDDKRVRIAIHCTDGDIIL